MTNFFIHKNDKQEGPFTFEELKTQNIQRNTLVWFQSLDKWMKAEHVEELKDLFALIPPPINLPPPIAVPPPLPNIPIVPPPLPNNVIEEKPKNIDETKEKLSIQPKNKSKIVRNLIIITVLILLGIVAYFIFNLSKNENSDKPTASLSRSSSNSTILVSNGENVNVRSSPNVDGDVIYQLGYGEQTLYQNQATGYKTRVEVNGIEYNNKWYKIAIKSNPSIVGWVHGGFITKPSNIE